MTITYTVKTQHVIMRSNDDDGSPQPFGTYDNLDEAYERGERFAFNEREHLGYPPGDERIQFPDRYRA